VAGKKVTIQTSGRIPEDEVFNVLLAVLEVNGVTAIRSGNLYKIMPTTAARERPVPTVIGGQADPTRRDDEVITQIVPLIAGSNHAALSLSKRLREAGFFATAIRPPTVPAGTARLRLAFTAAHSTADLDGLLEALDDRALPRSATA